MANKKAASYALGFALVAAILRLIAYFGGFITPETGQYVIFMHMLFILLTVFFGVRANRDEAGAPITLGTKIKSGFKAGGLYSVISTAFVLFYFKFIDKNYFLLKQQQLIQGQLSENPSLDPVTVKNNVEGFFSLMNYCTVTLLALMVMSFLYTIMIVLLDRALFRRFD